jgi:tRNA(fMet)-specific endonuclease VapC
MTFLLDTNICSAHLRRPSGLAHRFIQYSGRLCVPTVVLAELYTGAYHCENPRPLLGKIELLFDDVEVVPFDRSCAERFGIEQGRLLQKGIVVSTADMMIAAVALVHDLILVTHNTADFQHIPDLRLEDWLTT